MEQIGASAHLFVKNAPAQFVDPYGTREYPTEVPLNFECENWVWASFYKGFAHMLNFLACDYGHFRLGYFARQGQPQGLQ